MAAFDICAEFTTADRFCKIRDKVKGLVEFMSRTGKQPDHVQLYAGYHRYLVGAINSRLRREAKAKEKTENDLRRASKIKEKAKVHAEPVEGITFGGIPIQPYGYSRPRKVEA